MNKYLANSNKQSLIAHSLAVAKKTEEVLYSLGLEEKHLEKLKEIAYLSGLFHDLGKIDEDFQNYIKKAKNKEIKTTSDSEENRNPSTWHGVYHHEISWQSIVKNVLLPNSKFDLSASDIIEYATYWHHPAHPDNKRNSTNTIFKNLNNAIDIDTLLFLEELNEKSTYKFKINKTKSTRDISIPNYFEGPSSEEIKNQAYKTLITSCLIEADREVSSWSKEESELYLDKKHKIKKITPNKVSYILENMNDRSLGQIKLANLLSTKNISTCGIDTGAGKTRVFLNWKAFLNNNRKLIVVAAYR